MALIASIIAGDCRNRLISIATSKPTTPMIKNVPIPERSRLVV
jgi:hypothetical protein